MNEYLVPIQVNPNVGTRGSQAVAAGGNGANTEPVIKTAAEPSSWRARADP